MAYIAPPSLEVNFFRSTSVVYVADTDFDGSFVDEEDPTPPPSPQEPATPGGSVPLFLGSTEVTGLYLGSTPVVEIWYGSTKLWP